jgi:hypothetical protein
MNVLRKSSRRAYSLIERTHGAHVTGRCQKLGDFGPGQEGTALAVHPFAPPPMIAPRSRIRWSRLIVVLAPDPVACAISDVRIERSVSKPSICRSISSARIAFGWLPPGDRAPTGGPPSLCGLAIGTGDG